MNGSWELFQRVYLDGWCILYNFIKFIVYYFDLIDLIVLWIEGFGGILFIESFFEILLQYLIVIKLLTVSSIKFMFPIFK